MDVVRIQVKFHTEKEISLPYDLNYLISSYLYQCLTSSKPELADWLHEEGILYNNRRYKPLAFSNLYFTKRKFLSSHQVVHGEATLYISSMKSEICMALIKGIWSKKGLLLLDCFLPLVEVKILPEIEFQEVMQYSSISPVVVASQVDGRLHYCHPLESRFYDQLRYTLRTWYEIRWDQKLPIEEAIDISLLDPSKFNLRKSAVLSEIKKKKIKGYMMDLEVRASPKVQQVIYEQNLGNYSIQGFGMVSVRGGVKN